MIVDSIEIGAVAVNAQRATVHGRGDAKRGRSWEFRAAGVEGIPCAVQYPPATVRANGDVYHGRIFVDRREGVAVGLYGLLGLV